MKPPLLALQGAHVRFTTAQGIVQAVRGVDLAIHRGEAVGLVGESGSGKSTTGMAMLALQRLTSGRLLFDGEDITDWPERRVRPLRRRMQPVLQDPRAALNPRMTIGESVAEPLIVHRLASRAELPEKVLSLLDDVGLNARYLDRYPAQMSGGELQRAAIARALASSPEVLVLDEPISALDVSVGAQVLNLLADLRDRRGLSYLFIAHDLHAVAHLCDRAAVMYMGRVVERGPAGAVIDRPTHPYAKALIASIPDPFRDNDNARLQLNGDPPSALNPPSGCALHPRCPVAEQRCAVEAPALLQRADGRHVACLAAE
jgi:oligopeptide/dipeptide ABC transporter ATP-binding protein